MFGNLTYNNKVIKPSLRPVEAIAGMYDTQTKNYEYAIDNTNKYQTALTSIPVDENTKHVVIEAQKAFDEAIAPIAEKGDWENFALNSKKLGNDLANKHGLNAVQAYNEKIAARQEEIKEAIENGLSVDRARLYSQDDRKNSTKLTYDPELGRWEGGFNGGRQIVKQTDWGEKVVELVKGFKANTIPFKTKDGRMIVKDPSGSGYMVEGSEDSVSEEEIYKFAESYLIGNPDFMSELREDIYFDLSNRLYDPETGNMRTMTVEDLKQAVPPSAIEAIRQQFNLGKGDLAAELKKKDISVEQLYSEIKAKDKVNIVAYPAMMKEGFNNLKLNWHAPKNDGSGSSGIDFNQFGSGIVDTYSVEERNTSQDVATSAKVLTDAMNGITQLDEEYKILTESKSKNPYLINKNREDRAEKQRIADATIDRHSENLNLVPELKGRIEALVNSSRIGGQTDLENTIPGLDISMVSMQKLLYRAIAGEDIRNDLDQFINEASLKELTHTLQDQGVTSARESNLPNTDPIGNLKRVSKNKLNNKIKEFADELLKSADDGQIKYTESFASVSLPDMDSKTRLAHPLHQVDHAASNMSKQSPAFYRKFTHPSGLDVETYLKNNKELGSFDKILWEETEVKTSIDPARGTDGTKKPTVKMVLSIKQGDEINKIAVQAFVDEPSFNALYFENFESARQQLIQKKNQIGLKPSEEIQLNKYNAMFFDTSKYGTTFPNTRLYNAKDNDLVEFEFMDNAQKAQVRVSTRGSVNGFSYFLVEAGESPESDKYYATDREGNQVKITKDELADPKYTPIGGNTPYDLRVMMGELTSGTNNGGMTGTVDITNVFKSDIKEGVIPQLASKVVPHASYLKTKFPGLIVTDAFRPEDASYGAESSLHKVGKALDFRLNEDSKKLLALSDIEKELLNIKSVGLHGDHIHLEFL